jgi:hypothetical protein
MKKVHTLSLLLFLGIVSSVWIGKSSNHGELPQSEEVVVRHARQLAKPPKVVYYPVFYPQSGFPLREKEKKSMMRSVTKSLKFFSYFFTFTLGWVYRYSMYNILRSLPYIDGWIVYIEDKLKRVGSWLGTLFIRV